MQWCQLLSSTTSSPIHISHTLHTQHAFAENWTWKQILRVLCVFIKSYRHGPQIAWKHTSFFPAYLSNNQNTPADEAIEKLCQKKTVASTTWHGRGNSTPPPTMLCQECDDGGPGPMHHSESVAYVHNTFQIGETHSNFLPRWNLKALWTVIAEIITKSST